MTSITNSLQIQWYSQVENDEKIHHTNFNQCRSDHIHNKVGSVKKNHSGTLPDV